MEVKFKVLLSSSIKRKKPWPRFCWLGKVRSESAFYHIMIVVSLILKTSCLFLFFFFFSSQEKEGVFLLDDNRISEINLHSGQTKKKIPKLQQLLPKVLTMSSSQNGELWAFTAFYISTLVTSSIPCTCFLTHLQRDKRPSRTPALWYRQIPHAVKFLCCV